MSFLIIYMTTNNTIIDTLHNSPTIVLLKESAKQTPPEYSFLIPLFAALAGGALVLIGQGIDRHFKSKNEQKNNLRDVYANCRRIEAVMKNYYIELAYYMTATQYRWYCSLVTEDPAQKKHYDTEHIKYNNNHRELERKIGETMADFIGHVRKFQSLKAFDNSIEIHLESISNITHISAKKYEKSIPINEILNLVEEDQKRLKKEYYKNLIYFKETNDKLLSLI